MVAHASSTLLLYPEWIIWIIILFIVINLLATIICLALIDGLHAKMEYEHTVAYRELEAWRIKYRELWTVHEARRDQISALTAEHRKLKREYDRLWQDYQTTCDILGPMLPED